MATDKDLYGNRKGSDVAKFNEHISLEEARTVRQIMTAAGLWKTWTNARGNEEPQYGRYYAHLRKLEKLGFAEEVNKGMYVALKDCLTPEERRAFDERQEAIRSRRRKKPDGPVEPSEEPPVPPVVEALAEKLEERAAKQEAGEDTSKEDAEAQTLLQTAVEQMEAEQGSRPVANPNGGVSGPLPDGSQSDQSTMPSPEEALTDALSEEKDDPPEQEPEKEAPKEKKAKKKAKKESKKSKKEETAPKFVRRPKSA